MRESWNLLPPLLGMEFSEVLHPPNLQSSHPVIEDSLQSTGELWL